MTRLTLIERRQDCVVVSLDDDSLLEGLTDLRWRLRQVLADGTPTVLVDVSRVERLSSATIAALLWARRQSQARGGQVILRSPSRRSLEMLRRTGLGRLFAIDTAAAASTPGSHT
jgi:anti-sigma B factor antagonist